MNPDTNMLVVVGIVAVVVVLALLLAKKVGFKITDQGVSLTTDKNPDKDTATVKQVDRSKVDIETRKDQHIEVEGITGGSDVKIK